MTLNSLTARIPGVKDAVGVQNVAKWHEIAHVVRDLHELRVGDQGAFPGMMPGGRISCPREAGMRESSATFLREFFAEEAGRAAAVSGVALTQSDAFMQFVRLANLGLGTSPKTWPLLYRAATDIGVNISALVRQLELQGYVITARENGRNVLYAQASIENVLDEGVA